jgi:hypothetical protein
MKLPFDHNDKDGKLFLSVMTELDKHIKKNQKNILGKFSKMYTYQPIVREPSDPNELDAVSDDEEDTKKKSEPKKEMYKSFKAKFDINYNTKKLDTTVFVLESEDQEVGDDQDPDDIRSVKELEEQVTWMSKVRLILLMNKLWAARNKGNDGTRRYGVGFKVLQMEVVPSSRMSSIKDNFTRHAFVRDSGDAEESEAEEAGSDVEEAGSDAEDAGSDAEDAGSDAEDAGSEAGSDNEDEPDEDAEDEDEAEEADSDAASESEEEEVKPKKSKKSSKSKKSKKDKKGKSKSKSASK